MSDLNQIKNPLRIYSLIFVVVAVIVLILGGFTVYNAIDFNSNARKIEATVSNIASLVDKNNKPYRDTLVNYTVDGIEYQNVSLGTFVEGKETGDALEVYTSAKNPARAEAQLKSYMLSTFLLFIGALFLLSALLAARRLKRRMQEITSLIDQNHFVIAKVSRVDINTSMRIRGKNPFFLVCEYEGKTLYSDNIWLPLQRDVVGEEIKVYCSNLSFDLYYIDTRDLYQEA